jgi:hypothetical protein
MDVIERWSGTVWIGEDGRRWVAEPEAMAVSRSLAASNDEIARLEAQLAGAVQALERIATEAEKLWAQGRPTINSAWTASVARDGLVTAGRAA